MTVSGTKKDRRNKPTAADAIAKEDNEPNLTHREITAIHKRFSEIMGVKPKDLANNTLYEFIDSWYGVNYHLGGSDQSGIDCSGFTRKLYGDVFKIDLARTAHEQFENCEKIKHSSDAMEGDLVFFHVHSRHITHVGVYLINDYFVHASSSQGVVISNLNDEYWHKYYAGIGRVKDKS